MPTSSATAYHEAGHAAMAVKLGTPFEHVTIEAQEDAAGHVLYSQWSAEFDPDSHSRDVHDLTQRVVCTLLAGAGAESVHTGASELESYGATGDRQFAIDVAFRAGMSEAEAEAWIEWLRVRTGEMIRNPQVWKAIGLIADELLAHTTLPYQRCVELCRQAYVPINADGDAARDQIVRTFAAWTALSALRSGSPVKSRREVYGLIQHISFDQLLNSSALPIGRAEFDEWHRNTTLALTVAHPKLCIGWAAKIINVYLKTCVYIGGMGRAGLVGFIHPPIDGGLWRGLDKHVQVYADDWKEILQKTHAATRINQITTYDLYERIIEGCRIVAEREVCMLIEVEQFWDSGA